MKAPRETQVASAFVPPAELPVKGFSNNACPSTHGMGAVLLPTCVTLCTPRLILRLSSSSIQPTRLLRGAYRAVTTLSLIRMGSSPPSCPPSPRFTPGRRCGSFRASRRNASTKSSAKAPPKRLGGAATNGSDGPVGHKANRCPHRASIATTQTWRYRLRWLKKHQVEASRGGATSQPTAENWRW